MAYPLYNNAGPSLSLYYFAAYQKANFLVFLSIISLTHWLPLAFSSQFLGRKKIKVGKFSSSLAAYKVDNCESVESPIL